MTNGVVFGGSCCIYDQEAVKNLVKPCFVSLEAISLNQMEKLGMCNSMPSDRTVDLSSSIHSTEMDTSPIPIPLINPRNHCYLNSTLQVFFRVKDILFTNVSLNNCPEGKIVETLLTSLNSNSEAQMASFKNDIAFYKQFYDGKIQRDVYECFQGILTIMHLGTRHSILGPDGDLNDDDFVSSITKSGFSFTLKKTLTCLLCSKSTEFFIPSSDFHIYPTNLKSVQSLISNTLKSSLHKGCTCSDGNVEHSEILEFQNLPNILFLIVNRYSFNSRANKNSCFIIIDNVITIKGQIFDHAATIYHHGEHTTSGHYTCKITFGDVAYMCDDHMISKLDSICKEKSKSCYIIIFLKRNNLGLTQ